MKGRNRPLRGIEALAVNPQVSDFAVRLYCAVEVLSNHGTEAANIAEVDELTGGRSVQALTAAIDELVALGFIARGPSGTTDELWLSDPATHG